MTSKEVYKGTFKKKPGISKFQP